MVETAPPAAEQKPQEPAKQRIVVTLQVKEDPSIKVGLRIYRYMSMYTYRYMCVVCMRVYV